MREKRKIKVLIIDDSLLFREFISQEVRKDSGIVVVGTAADPFDARDKIIDLEPDVITCDIEMPKMNGIEFIRRLMPQYPLPAVIVSSLSDNVFEALNAGAVDFVVKPAIRTSNGMEGFINELIVKIKIASMANVSLFKNSTLSQEIHSTNMEKADNVIIAIGASTGGTEAIFDIIHALPKDMPGIVIVQHMPPGFTKMYANRLNNSCKLEVKEAETSDKIIKGRVLIAPGDKHLKIVRKSNAYFVECFEGEKVNGHKPSVDVLFNSAAEACGSSAIGIILTGMGYDGAKGLLKMKEKGAITIGQDEKSCVVYGMPKVAYDIGGVSKQLPLKSIPEKICSLVYK